VLRMRMRVRGVRRRGMAVCAGGGGACAGGGSVFCGAAGECARAVRVPVCEGCLRYVARAHEHGGRDLRGAAREGSECAGGAWGGGVCVCERACGRSTWRARSRSGPREEEDTSAEEEDVELKPRLLSLSLLHSCM